MCDHSRKKSRLSLTNMRAYAYKRHIGSILLRICVWSAAIISLAIIISMILYIVIKGAPNLKLSLFSLKYNSENVSMLPAILNTLEMMLITLLLSIPTGVFSAVYMVEYAKKSSGFVKLIRMTCETLQGIPSIVYGLFGYILFVLTFGWSFSMIAGVLTLSIMVLPLIIRTTEEALISVPDSYREGSFGLGAGKLRTVIRVVIPNAIPGIFAGVILSMGRVIGESAALIYTAGTGSNFTGDISNSSRTLAVHLFCLYNEGLYTNEAYATAFVLLIMVIGINTLSAVVAKKLTSK